MVRLSEIGQESRELRVRDYTKEIGRRIASGELTLAEGIREHMSASAGENVASASSSYTRHHIVQEAAQGATLRIAVDALKERGEELTAAVETAREELVDELEKLAKLASGLDAAGAIQEGGKNVDAYREVSRLEPRRRALAGCWSALRSLEILDKDEARPLEFAPRTDTHSLLARMAPSVRAEATVAV
jgi:hypothetical protein